MDSFRRPLSGVRHAAGTRVKGRWVEGAVSPISFKASVQPVTPEIMQTVPELRRNEARYALFTDFRLIAADVDAGVNADKVTINGDEHEVLSVDIWQNDVISHYMAVAGKVKTL